MSYSMSCICTMYIFDSLFLSTVQLSLIQLPTHINMFGQNGCVRLRGGGGLNVPFLISHVGLGTLRTAEPR